MGLCAFLLIITMIATDGASRILNSSTYIILIFTAYMWYREAVDKEKAKQPEQPIQPKKKFTVQH